MGAPLSQPLGVLETFGRGVGSEMEKLVGKTGLDSEKSMPVNDLGFQEDDKLGRQ